MTGNALAQAHVVILQGGPSPEAEVSRSSAAGLEQALTGLAGQLTRLEVDRDLSANLLALAPDVVFPALHGPPGEDGTVQGLLDLLGIPYVGSGVAASVTAMDKTLAKHCFRAAGLPVARDVVVPRETTPEDAAAMVQSTLGNQVVVKPSQQGSALGVTLVDSPEALEAALELALSFGDAVLVEERLAGRELTAAIFAPVQQDAVALPLIEIVTPSHSWYDYEHRYAPGASEHLVPAPVSDAEAEALKHIALAAHDSLGCRDLSRAVLILTQAGPMLLEVNTLPGMTPTSLYPDAAKAAGLPFPQLARSLVRRPNRGPRLASAARFPRAAPASTMGGTAPVAVLIQSQVGPLLNRPPSALGEIKAAGVGLKNSTPPGQGVLKQLEQHRMISLQVEILGHALRV